MPSSFNNRVLVLRDHWRTGTPPLLDLRDGDEPIGTETTEQTISMESGPLLTTEGLTLPWVPSLLQIKRHLRLEDDDTEDNERLVIHREAAAVMLLKEIGQDGRVEDYEGEAEFENGTYRLIKIDRSNIQSVASVTEVDDEGTETIVPDTEYSIRYKNGVAYLDGEFNADQDKAMVKVAYRRGFALDGQDTALMLQVMLDTIHSLYVNPGRLTDMAMRRSPAFNAAMMLLRDRRSTVKWSY